MPHTTMGYQFEGRIMLRLGLIADKAHVPSDDFHPFLLLLRPSGRIWHVLWGKQNADEMKQLREKEPSYVFVDPFEPMEQTWVEWRNVSRANMEQLIGEEFQEGDFVRSQFATKAADLPEEKFPTTWGVMF
jgi:hypothetical protein